MMFWGGLGEKKKRKKKKKKNPINVYHLGYRNQLQLRIHYPLTQWFSNCGTRTTSGTRAPSGGTRGISFLFRYMSKFEYFILKYSL